MSDGQKPVRWESWAKAFADAGALEPGVPYLTLRLPPDQFRAALRALDHEMDGLSAGDERYQRACRVGSLEWCDEMGARVWLIRIGGPVDREQPAASQPPSDLSGATIAKMDEALIFRSAHPPAPGDELVRVNVGPPPPPPGVHKDAAEPSGIVAAVKSVLPKGKKK